MMRRNKAKHTRLLLCGLLICALILPACLAENNEATPAPATETPTSAPAPEVTQAPATDPTSDPTSEPAPSPTSEPSSEPTAAPSNEPTPQPSSDPTSDPSSEPTMQPAQSPDVSPTPSPDATPLPLPGESSDRITITPEGSAQENNGVWSISLSDPSAPLAFGWVCNESASHYLVYTKDAQDNARFIVDTADVRVELSAMDYMQGSFTLHVGAVLSDGQIIWGSISFELAGGMSGGMPGGFGGFGGGMPGAMGGDMPEGEMGFRVTPGQALTSSHSSGSMDTSAYASSTITAGDAAVSALTLDSTQTVILLDDGASNFFVSSSDASLTLTPQSEGEEWQLSLLALNTLFQSGVDQAVFHIGNTSITLSTDLQLYGDIYAQLRSQGYVRKDFKLRISASGVQVCIDAESLDPASPKLYSINESGELVSPGV